jgi:predicted O-linked N-acetylglucosamine transferase (SPINDLY family)
MITVLDWKLSDFMSTEDQTYQNAKLHFESASELMMCERWNEAETELRKSLHYFPGRVSTSINLSAVLLKLGRFQEAKVLIEKALALDPDNPAIHMNAGLILWNERQFEAALKKFEFVIELQSDSADAWLNRGNALKLLRRLDDALLSFKRAFELNPIGDFYLGALVHAKMHLCDWADLDLQVKEIEARIKSGRKVSTPFSILGLFDSPELQRLAAESAVNPSINSSSPLCAISPKRKKEKIRVGYFSMDFYNHPVSFLLADLIDAHDRTNFEIYAFSFGHEVRDEMRIRLEKSFDKFFDLKDLDESEIAKFSRKLDLDIAIDLAGYTNNSKPEIFFNRVAPIQINYLGYPGTWGNKCMDYFIGDQTTVTESNQTDFIEKIIFLPNSFQVNSRTRDNVRSEVSRRECGLPEDVFVFCCFNNTWKITPDMFSIWIRILLRVKESVLWLYADNLTAEENLTKQILLHGISTDRLIFLRRLPRDEYLSRYGLADLFLDTHPYNAGTTASDALWMGLPVLTLAGRSFVSRMAMSLLNNLGSDFLSESLVTSDIDQYEARAVELALNKETLKSLKTELRLKRGSASLFDTALFARQIEAAYKEIHVRHRAGLRPDHLYIENRHKTR